IYLFFYSSFFIIDQIEIRGNQELTYDTIRYEVNKAFVERRFLVLRQSNFYIYNTKEAEQYLWDTFVLDEVSITKRFPDKLIVNLKEKIPNLTLVTEKAFYYMDLEGIVTHIVPETDIKEHFPKVEDMNKRSIKLKDQIISREVVDAIFTLKDSFSGKTNSEIDRFLIPETTCASDMDEEEVVSNDEDSTNVNTSNTNTNSSTSKNSNLNANSSNNDEECNLVAAIQDIAVLTTEGWRAYFTINDEIETQLERLKVYLLKKALDKQTRENIDYIDLRFGEKIYIKE
ncbi:FtsQ-type POTRA domain-containing protein, partial [Patescibacteria group bacterium]|nr:FtsQ-type POTRA domain-containing protein [Patescibacteria group bacterium]